MMTSTLATSTMVTGADRFMAELVLIGLILSLGVFSVSDGPTNERTDKIFLGSSRIRHSLRETTICQLCDQVVAEVAEAISVIRLGVDLVRRILIKMMIMAIFSYLHSHLDIFKAFNNSL